MGHICKCLVFANSRHLQIWPLDLDGTFEVIFEKDHVSIYMGKICKIWEKMANCLQLIIFTNYREIPKQELTSPPQ